MYVCLSLDVQEAIPLKNCHVEELVELDSDMEEGMDIGILQASSYSFL